MLNSILDRNTRTRRPSHSIRWNLALILSWILLPACTQDASRQQAKVGDTTTTPKPVAESHRRMIGVLNQIRLRVPQENAALGDAGLRNTLDQLATMPRTDSPQRFELLTIAGALHIRLGETEQGIRKYQEAYEMASRAGDKVPPEVLVRLEYSMGIAYLRLAENENCVEGHNADSCLLPIRGAGIHQHRFGVTKAIEYFTRVLASRPDHLPSRWLLNVAHMAKGDYPDSVPERFTIPPDSFESETSIRRFRDCAPSLGLDTFSLAGGAIVDDFNQDGLLDIVVSDWDPSGQLRIFLNRGDRGFEDATVESGLVGIYGGLNMVHADYDNDGDVDIFVLRGGWLGPSGRPPNSLLQNDGLGSFSDVTFDAGLAEESFPTQTASWADYDNDGDLDLYVGNERFANQLFQNQGNGTFKDVAPEAGVDHAGFAKGVVWGDYDGDGLADIYVSNLNASNQLYRNLGEGRFVDVAGELGVTGPQKSFPVWFWDFNNDGASTCSSRAIGRTLPW